MIDIGLKEQLVYDIDQALYDYDTPEYHEKYENREISRNEICTSLNSTDGISAWINWCETVYKNNDPAVHIGLIRDLKMYKKMMGTK